MIKKIVLPVFWFCGVAGMLHAQVSTNVRFLKQAAVEYKISSDANYAKALTMARQKGWDLSFISKDGNRAVLVGVDDFGFPKYYITNNNTTAAATTRANQLWPGGASGLGLTGSSTNMKNKIAIWDGGAVLGTHVELNGRITQKDNPASPNDHATHVTGTMIASGVNPSAKGMAYGALGLLAYDFTSDISEISNEAPNIVLSNHSYSIIAGWNFNTTQNRWEFNGRPNDNEDYKFGYYSDDSQSLDDIAYNAPFYLIVKSAGNNRDENGPAIGQPYFRPNASGQMISAGNRPAGISSNDGYDIISWDIGAKNILSVGAVEGLPGGYSRKEDVVLTKFSSWGPTDDGRIKPEVVADGANVLSCTATSNTSYASFSGTSMSAPNATGSLFLLQEYYSKLKAGAFLRSATLKGLAIHTAEESGLTPGPDYQFGWGLLNVEKAAAVITAAVPSNNAATSPHLLFENVLAQGATFTTTVIASGKGSLSATICWTDVKGTVEKVNLLNERTKKLINDLDIRITRGSGTTLRTFMPWTLDVNNPSFAAVPGDNTIDNAERIDVDSTVPGQAYTLTVSHKGTLVKGPQAYSLLVSGVGGAAYCASAPTTNAGSRIDSVSFKTIRFSNPAGNTTYTDNTRLVADIEPSQTIPITIKVGSADATNVPKIVKVFIDFNNNGVFEASELVATSGPISNGALFTANIVTPSSLVVGNISLMRIVVQETSVASDVTACSNAGYTRGETQDYRVRVVNSSNDLAINEIVAPASGNCSNDAQYVTVKIRNNGSVDQSNIPITIAVSNGSTNVLNISATYPGTISALSTVTYTFQTPFALLAGNTYSITATVNLANDQNPANNTLASTVLVAAKPTVSGIGGICGSTVFLKVNNPDAGNFFWYSTPTINTPFAAGPSVTTTTIPADKTYYLAKEAMVNIGPANKLVFPQGGYNTYYNNYIKFNNSVPIVIETSRLYIGNPGQIRFIVGDNVSEDATNGSFSYRPIASTTIDAYATNPNPTPGAVAGNPANDPGAIFRLNLPVSTTGDHILLIQCINAPGRSDSATIFRNNQISGGSTYPISIPNIVSITGNSASLSGSVASQFYYFLYDTRITTGACVSDRVPVVAATIPTPVITQVADSLVSSIATGNQWYLNDTAINNANTNHFKPTKSGTYKVIVTDGFGCQKTSNTISVVITALDNASSEEIKLKVSPNPNNGVFNLSFEVNTKADLSIDILSASGQRVFNSVYPNFSGKFSKVIHVPGLSSEFYILKIRHNKKNYLEKLIIQRQ